MSRELLAAAESVLKDALKCSKVRCFLVTSSFIGMDPPGSLVYFEPEEDNEPGWDKRVEDEGDFNPAVAMLGKIGLGRRGSQMRMSLRASMKGGALANEQVGRSVCVVGGIPINPPHSLTTLILTLPKS